MEDIIASVKDQYPQLIIVAIAFIIMVQLMKRNLFEPILGILAQRRSDREGLEKETGSAAEESLQLAEDRKQRLLTVRNEALKIKEGARSSAHAEGTALLDEVTSRLSKVKEDKSRELETELSAAREAMKDDIPRMARQIAEQILQRPLA